MLFNKTRKKMQDKMVAQNDKYLYDSLMPNEEIKLKLVSNMPHGQISRDILAITDKRLIIIKVDKASMPHVSSLKFNDITEVTHHKGSLSGLGITFTTHQRQIPTGVFEKDGCLNFLHTLEAKRFE